MTNKTPWKGLLGLFVAAFLSIGQAQALNSPQHDNYLQKKSLNTIQRINQTLPANAKLTANQRDQIARIVIHQQKRLIPLKKNMSSTNELILHTRLDRRKHSRQLKQLYLEQRQLGTRINVLRKQQEEQIGGILTRLQKQHFINSQQRKPDLRKIAF